MAAIGAGIPIQEPQGHMIVDIGGGTTDVAVISLGGIVSSQSVKCAGNRLDDSLSEYIKDKYNLAIGERTAEEIKIKIGSATLVDEPLSMQAKGRDQVSGLPKQVSINSNELIPAIRKDLLEMIEAIKRVLQDTPPELASDIIDRGILMTGGTSQLRNFNDLIAHHIGVKTILAEDALFCVARGTGIALEHLDVYKHRSIAKS